MSYTAPDCLYTSSTVPELDRPVSAPKTPDIILPGGDFGGLDICYGKRQRVCNDGRYSPCPSSNGSTYSPFPDPDEASTFSTPCSALLSPRYSPSPQPLLTNPNTPEPEKKADDSRSILDGLMANLSTVFNAKALKEVDHEVCFGMITGTIASTDQNLCLLQKLHAKNTGESSTYPLHLKVDSIRNSNQVQVIIDTGHAELVLGALEALLSIAIAPLLKSSLVRVQALTLPPFVSSTERRKKRRARTEILNIFINLYGDQTHKDRVGRFLCENGIFLQHPKFPEPGYLYKNPHILSRPGAPMSVTEYNITGGVISAKNSKGLAKEEIPINTRKLSNIFDELCESETFNELSGDWRLTTPLLGHQRQGLYFLTRREQYDQGSLGLSPHGSQPKRKNCSVRGGILADYMGLGKTLTILSLVVGSLDEARLVTTDSCLLPGHVNTATYKIRSGATLLIAPVSTLGNWEEQIAAHVQPNALKYCVYYGKDKPTNPRVLGSYDIVFTSFQTVTQEWKNSQHSPYISPLFAIKWFRLVLDEAHVIRTQKTNQCQAACALSAERRWCVTGTPLQNDITDIATLFKFLRYEPLNTKENFDQYVVSKLKTGDKAGMENLRAALKLICLRRAKDTISGKLPAQREVIRYLEFNSDERILYNSYKQKWDSGHSSNMTNSFQMLLSLRLICDHGKDLLPQGELEICCVICGIQLRDWEMGDKGQMPCIHRAICRNCIDDLETADDKDILGSGCQLCSGRRETLGHCVSADFPNYRGPSTKVRTLTASIKETISKDIANFEPPSKHVVFSSWTRMLDLVGIALKHEGILFCRLDGSMPRSQRNATIVEFSTNSRVIVILVSLMAGGVGINLTCASRVHLLEPHWNPMVEQQAVERVHRLGQRRDVVITRYIMRDSFEIDMLNHQKKKLDLAKQSLDPGASVVATKDIEMGY